MNDLYKELILDHYQNPRHYGRLKKSTLTLFGDNPFCGDSIVVDLKIKNKKIMDAGFISQGCIISKASASIFLSWLIGKDLEELKKIDKNFIINLLKIDLTPTRLKCALLVLMTVKKVFNVKS